MSVSGSNGGGSQMGGNPTLSNTVELFQRGEGGIHVYKEKQFVAV